MSKSVKTILSVAAVVAIPFAAPALAGSAFFAPMAAKLGATGASTLIGAGLGAGKAAVFGEDVGKGALFGGLSGGIAGYSQAREAANAANAANAGTAGLNVPQGTGIMNTGVADPAALSATDLAQAGLRTAGTAPALAATPPGPSVMEALKSVPAEIAKRYQDPQVMADLTLRAAGMMAGSLAAGQGLSDQERALVQAQRRDLEQQQRMNAEVFRARLSEAQTLIGESAYFDPEYFGLQSARRAQMAGDQAKRAGLRGMQGDKRAVAQRQYDLATARNKGTAYDTGYATGVEGRLRTRAAGLAAFPGAYPSSSGDFDSLMKAYGMGEGRKRERQQDVGKFLDPFLNPQREREVYDDELPRGNG